ncbi:MAG: SprT-like domain-containing protein [Porticoccaceae bacterium]|nr:SprT-like domain-containing protein [Porticoccaceae bacterium]
MINATAIEPISELQQTEVRRATQQCISRAEQIYNRRFKPLQVDFDLRGKCAGMYQVKRLERRIRFNPWIFAKYYQDSLHDTVAHEVAHYIVDCLYGLRKVKPHGREWQAVMRSLGAEPKATGSYDLTGIPRRQYQRFAYRCGCRTHNLTILRHRKVMKGVAKYLCQYCHGPLAPVETTP